MPIEVIELPNGPFNVQQVNRLIEVDDGMIWFSAGEFGSTDVWFYDPSTESFTKVDAIGVGLPFDSLADVATDSAGTQFSCWFSGGAGAEAYRTYDDAGTRGSDISIPEHPYGIQAAPIIFAGGYIVGTNGHGGPGLLIGAMDTSGTTIWNNSSTNLDSLDCIGSDGLIWGRTSDETKISKIDPVTGTETLIATTSGFFSAPAFDGSGNFWTYDGTDILVYDTSGTLLHNYGALPSDVIYGLLCYRPHDGLMYLIGVDPTTGVIPLYSIDMSGTIVNIYPSVDTNHTRYLGTFLCASDGKTMYCGATGSSHGFFSDAVIYSIIEAVGNLVMLL